MFYLQAGEPGRVVSFKLEKAQVLFLAGGLSEVLADLASPGELPDDLHLELEQPVEAEWAVGSMQLAYDPERDRVILVARELSEEEGEAGPGTQPLGVDLERLLTGSEPGAPGAARVMLTREQAAAMVRRGRELLAAGRPPCPLCGYPLEEDHSCPKTNGHRAPSL